MGRWWMKEGWKDGSGIGNCIYTDIDAWLLVGEEQNR